MPPAPKQAVALLTNTLMILLVSGLLLGGSALSRRLRPQAAPTPAAQAAAPVEPAAPAGPQPTPTRSAAFGPAPEGFRIPTPSAYDPRIAQVLQAIRYENVYTYTANLVNNYSPRHYDFNQVYVDSQCTLGEQRFEQNNLVRSLEDTEAKLLEMGYFVVRQNIPEKHGGGFNLLVVKNASAETTYESFLEIGAHIDADADADGSSGYGANDNAAAVGGLLEIARVLRDYPNQHPWRFIVFTKEENGLKGSIWHNKRITNRNETIKAALVMDAIAWSESEPQYMNCIWTNPDIPASVEIGYLYDQVRTTYGIDMNWRLCPSDGAVSDNVPYWERGRVAVLSIGGLPQRHATRHSCNDDMDHVDMQNAYRTVQENAGVLLLLDQTP